ncbi:hypothetical protein GCM10010211_20570 [Streptomyces albospinus]|uniref:Uncharacterized protein n=1 Tax=Streptomyces albospinus TaxID=285515 RepID=A0ABQ2UXZ2_9ACTN|nr:hypothetical protein [Streptomyces albospinus]GGU55680.1 hypothetical protein GCM10010211_20570 [Streptomyces albospinus]
MSWIRSLQRTGARDSDAQAAAWQAQLTLALRAPACAHGAHYDDPDSLVGASVEHSVHVDRALTNLLTALGPNHPLTLPVFDASRASHELTLLREPWLAHCAEHALPTTDDTVRALDREFPAPERVRAWASYDTARRRTEHLLGHLVPLQDKLAAFTGHSLTAPQGPTA